MKTMISAPLSFRRSKGPIAQAFVLCGALALLGGCASEPESHRLSGPPPPEPTTTVVTQQAQPVPVVVTNIPSNTGVTTIYVTQAPPAMQQEVIIARPSTSHVWVPGYWTWRNQRYEWMAGHWGLPPRSNATWVAPRWEREDNSYRFYEGYWN